MVHSWNTHNMRPDRKIGRGGGRPVLLYSLPELSGAEDKLVSVNIEELLACKAECTPKSAYPCDRDIFELCCILMDENRWTTPNDGYEAAHLYELLRNEIRRDIGL